MLIVSIFDPDDLRPLKDEISSFIDQHARRALHEEKISTLYENKDFAHHMGHLMREHPGLADTFDICELRGIEMFRFMAHPKLM